MNANEPPKHETVFDDATQHVAGVYAEAFLNAGRKSGQVEELIADLDALVNQVFAADPGLELFFTSRAVSRDRKAAALRGAFQSRASDLFLNFLLVLNAHDRLDAIRSIAATVRDRHEEQTGKVRVEVRSAVPLTDEQQEKLRQQLRASLGREPVLETRVDPALLGGLTVQIGDTLYDGSIRTRLEQIRNQLIERSSYAIQSQRNRFSA